MSFEEMENVKDRIEQEVSIIPLFTIVILMKLKIIDFMS